MAQRAIVIRYDNPQVDENGNFLLYVIALFVDTAVPGSGKLMSPVVTLDAATPAGWTNQIKTATVQTGIDNGFPNLTAANVYVPAYN